MKSNKTFAIDFEIIFHYGTVHIKALQATIKFQHMNKMQNCFDSVYTKRKKIGAYKEREQTIHIFHDTT